MEIVLVAGLNGAGKSTLLRHVIGGAGVLDFAVPASDGTRVGRVVPDDLRGVVEMRELGKQAFKPERIWVEVPITRLFDDDMAEHRHRLEALVSDASSVRAITVVDERTTTRRRLAGRSLREFTRLLGERRFRRAVDLVYRIPQALFRYRRCDRIFDAWHSWCRSNGISDIAMCWQPRGWADPAWHVELLGERAQLSGRDGPGHPARGRQGA